MDRSAMSVAEVDRRLPGRGACRGSRPRGRDRVDAADRHRPADRDPGEDPLVLPRLDIPSTRA
ncbi:hypothetical protein [Umezawaea sp.]|uniref:hypothetical protein n=1 Tax=Umezawaea sp. TaxID=1955258 RepID=UPI002ED340B1